MKSKTSDAIQRELERWDITIDQILELADEGLLYECGVTEIQQNALLSRIAGTTLRDVGGELEVSIESARTHVKHALRNLSDFTEGTFELNNDGVRKSSGWKQRSRLVEGE